MRSLALALLLALTVAPPLTGQALRLMTSDLKRVQALARADSNDAEMQYYLALAYWQKHRWPQVDSVLRLVIRLDPRFAEGYLALSYLPYARRRTLSAEEERGRVPEAWRPKIDPRFAQAHAEVHHHPSRRNRVEDRKGPRQVRESRPEVRP